MSKEQYSATITDSDREVTVEYDFGDNLQEAVELFGEEVVFSRFKSAAVIDLQSLIRRHIKAKEEDGTDKFTDTQIQESATAWKPGIKTVSRKSKQEKIKDLFSAMSDDDRQALLEQLLDGDSEESSSQS